MKKLLFICALFIGATPMVSAQQASTNDQPSPEEYERMIENHYKVEFRKMAYEAMELSEEEITGIDPLYNDYTARKMDIVDRRNRLINEYRDEMQEDDDAEEKDDERADFIENYWETQIAEMELKKDYFDRMEDVVTTEKAIQFFLLEEKAQSRMEEVNLIGIVPMMINVREYYPMKKKGKKMKMKKHDSSMNWEEKSDADEKRMANRSAWSDSDDDKMKSDKNWTSDADTKKEWSDKEMSDDHNDSWTSKGKATYSSNTNGLSAFNQWIEKEGNGVAINHNYTSNGLESLVNAIWSVAEEHNIDASAWSGKKDKVMSITRELQKNPASTDHADLAQEAFTITAEMINAIQDEKGTDKTKGFASQVKSAAHAINPDRLMTNQANDIYAFFSYANQALQAFSNTDEKWKSTSASTQDNK